MIWIVFVLVLIAMAALAFAIFNREDDVKFGAWVVAGVAGLLSVVLFIFSCVTVVKSGHVGVPVTFGVVNNKTIDSGLHFVNPFCHVEEMSVRTENYWMSHDEQEGNSTRDDSVSVRSSNGLQMPVDLSVPYRLIPDTAPWVYRNLGRDYVEKILRVSLSTAARRAASHYTAEELYSTKRDEFASRTKELLDEEIGKVIRDNYKNEDPPETVLVISQVLVGHVGIPETVKHAIEAKLKADQEQQAMEFTILREKKEAERKRVEAEGIQKFQEIVTKGIDDRLLRWKAIDATLHLAQSPNSKVIVIGSGHDGLPVLLHGTTGDVQLQAQPKK